MKRLISSSPGKIDWRDEHEQTTFCLDRYCRPQLVVGSGVRTTAAWYGVDGARPYDGGWPWHDVPLDPERSRSQRRAGTTGSRDHADAPCELACALWGTASGAGRHR